MGNRVQILRGLLTRRQMSVVMLAVSAFVIMQLVSTAHGAEFGFDAHSHDGQVCELPVVDDNKTRIDAPAPDSQRIHFSTSLSLVLYEEAARAQAQRQRPPTRAPPLSLS